VPVLINNGVKLDGDPFLRFRVDRDRFGREEAVVDTEISL
jgi:hypothetical protein